MSFDDLLYECFSTSDYVQDTFGYQESRLPRDGFMWFPEFCRINNSLDRSLREAAFERFKPGVRIVCGLFNHLRGVGEAFDELLTHDDPSKGLSYEDGYLRLDRIGLNRGVVPVRDLSLSMTIGEQLKLQHKIGGRIYHVEVIYPYPTDPGIHLVRDLDTFESMYIGEYSLIKEAYEGLFMINRKLVFGWWNRSLNILG